METIETIEGSNPELCPVLNGPISVREILLSKTIGKPYPTYILAQHRCY